MPVYDVRAEVNGVPYTFPRLQIPQPLHASIESYISTFEKQPGYKIKGYQIIDAAGLPGPTIVTDGTAPGPAATVAGVPIAGVIVVLLIVWFVWRG